MAEKTILSVRIDEETGEALTTLMERLGCEKSEAIRHALLVASKPPKPVAIQTENVIKAEDILVIKNMVAEANKSIRSLHNYNSKTAGTLDDFLSKKSPAKMDGAWYLRRATQ